MPPFMKKIGSDSSGAGQQAKRQAHAIQEQLRSMEVLPIEDVDIIQNREELTHSDDDENDKRRVALYASNDKIENLS